MLDAMQSVPATGLVLLLAAAALVVTGCGVRLTRLADRLADRTGLGEAIIGALLLGMVTSLSGVVVSVTAAAEGRASLAFSNGVGGIAAQTAFLAVADLAYRRINLEHASAEVTSLFQAALLALMISLPFIAFATGEVTILGLHPVSLALFAVYLVGARSMSDVRAAPMWRPVRTGETRKDLPEGAEPRHGDIWRLGLEFLLLAAMVGGAGWVIAQAGARLADLFGISDTAVGALMTAVVTSLPELVTTLAAVRRGALQLAVGGIIGGNSFDMLFLSLSDAAYRDGSLYHAIMPADLFWLAVGLAMTAVLLLGLIVRERRGIAGIGFESAGILVIYLGAVLIQAGAG